MNPKIVSILEKVAKERSKGNQSKALRRLIDGLDKYPGEEQLYRDVIELSLEAGEPLQAVKFFKKANSRFPGERDSLWEYAMTQVKRFSDPVLGKHLLEQSVKNWNLVSGYRVAKYFDERTAKDLLVRTRKKKETLSSALKGGHGLSGELAINALSEAILNLRTGRISEAIRLFINRMVEDPQVCSEFDPFLQELEREFPQKGIVRFALGHCYLLTGQPDKGVKKIAKAVKMNASLAEEAAECLTKSCRDIESPPESLEIALLETFLAQGNSVQASDHARSILNSKPHQAQFILDLLQKYLSGDQTCWEMEKLYLETSLEANQVQRALQFLRNSHHDSDQKRDLYDWLEELFKAGNLPAEIMIFFGQDVLESGRPDWALRIFREMVVKYPADGPAIAKILEKSQQSSPEINLFHREIGGRDEATDNASGFDIQHFERSEFSLSNFGRPQPEPGPAPDPGPAESAPATSAPFERETPIDLPPAAAKPDELTVDEPPVLSSSPEPEEAEEPGFESGQEDVSDSIEVEPSPPADVFPTPEPPPQPVEIFPAGSDAYEAPVEAGDDLDTETEFDRDYQQFQSGKLNNGTTLNLIDNAFNLGKLDAVKTLLTFQPATASETSRRILYLAELHIHQNRALPALIALKSIDHESLSTADRHIFLSRMAACYRELNMYDAANSVLIKLLNENPTDTAIEQLAKLNYEDYLNECCEGTPVLEKTSLLS